MAKAERTASRARFASLLLLLALAATTACEDKIPANLVIGNETTAVARQVVGVAEVTFRDLNTAAISATMVLAPSVAELEQLRTNPAGANTLTSAQLQLITVGEFLHTPTGGPNARFVHATFGLDNTPGSSLFDAARENVLFVGAGTPLTIAGTPIRALLKADGTSVGDALALQVAPTALVALNELGDLVTIDGRTLVTLTAADSANTAPLTGITRLFPFGFSVLRPPAVPGLPASPFAGVVTFAFQLPELDVKADNPTTLSVLFVLVNDTTAQPH
jgi:hypothetical protein